MLLVNQEGCAGSRSWRAAIEPLQQPLILPAPSSTSWSLTEGKCCSGGDRFTARLVRCGSDVAGRYAAMPPYGGHPSHAAFWLCKSNTHIPQV